MSYQHDRDEFIAETAKRGLPLTVAEALLRAATTLHQLAERECNGDDWHMGDLVPCPVEQAAHARNCTRRLAPMAECSCEKGQAWCPTCSGQGGEHGRVSVSSVRVARTMRRLERLMRQQAPAGFGLRHSGDPRGAVLKLTLPDGATNDWGRTGWCVPSRPARVRA